MLGDWQKLGESAARRRLQNGDVAARHSSFIGGCPLVEQQDQVGTALNVKFG